MMLPTTEDSAIGKKTLELCQSILDQPEYKSVRQKIDTFLADTAAQTQYESVLNQGNMLQQKQQTGVPMDGGEVTAFETERQKLLDNPVAKGFLEAQEALHEVQSTVNDYLRKTMELGRIPNPEDLDSHSCGDGGCGCNH